MCFAYDKTWRLGWLLAVLQVRYMHNTEAILLLFGCVRRRALCLRPRERLCIWRVIFFHDSTALACLKLLNLEISRSQSAGHTTFDRNPLEVWSASRRDRIEHIHKISHPTASPHIPFDFILKSAFCKIAKGTKNLVC